MAFMTNAAQIDRPTPNSQGNKREAFKGIRTRQEDDTGAADGFGALVEARRRSLGMTRQDLAARAFTAPRTIRDLEEGRTSPARRTTGVVVAVLELSTKEVAREVGIEESAAANWAERGKREIELRRQLEELWAS